MGINKLAASNTAYITVAIGVRHLALFWSQVITPRLADRWPAPGTYVPSRGRRAENPVAELTQTVRLGHLQHHLSEKTRTSV